MPTLFQINVVANSGSTGRIAEGIAEVAMYNKWSCYTAYGRWANPSITELYRIGTKWDNYIHYFMSNLFDMHGLSSKRATKQLIKQIKKVNPDLIHIHNLHGYYLNYPLLFNYLSEVNIPVVWTLHDCWSYTGHCVHYTSVNCDKWLSECCKCPNLFDYPTSLFWDHSRTNFQLKKEVFTSVKNLTIVAVSKWLANEVKQSFLKKYPIKVIHNGFDMKIFYPVESEMRLVYGLEKKFIILGVATVWNNRKGLNDFITLSKRLSSDEVIMLVGLNDKQISELPNNIIGIKNTENACVLAELYSSADLFANFSEEETFGLTTVESMACGTPVLVYNSTACPEIVTEQTGFVIKPHDIDGAFGVIKQVKSIGKQYYSDHCCSYAQTNFSKEDKYKEYVALYNELLHQ